MPFGGQNVESPVENARGMRVNTGDACALLLFDYGTCHLPHRVWPPKPHPPSESPIPLQAWGGGADASILIPIRTSATRLTRCLQNIVNHCGIHSVFSSAFAKRHVLRRVFSCRKKTRDSNKNESQSCNHGALRCWASHVQAPRAALAEGAPSRGCTVALVAWQQ